MTGCYITLLILNLSLWQCSGQQFWDDLADEAKELFGVKSTTILFRKYGYPAEAHDVVTDDGYVLRLDRIPRPGHTVVLLGNAMTCNSACYCGLQNDSLAFKLYNAGFDVWLGNFRGSGLSINHTKYNVLDHEFWNYSWHEHGTTDLPTMLEYVVKVTGQPDVVYGGHSMAATAGLITVALRPDSAKLIRGNFFLGPVNFMAFHSSALLAALHTFENFTQGVEQAFGPSLFPFSNYIGRRAGAILCRSFVPVSIPYNDCFIFTVAADITAGTSDVVYPEDFEDYVPSGASLLQVLHYTQLANRNWPGFRQFNYGRARNQELYGQDTPPDYDLSKNEVPTYLYLGRTDEYATVENTMLLTEHLKNVRKVYTAPEEKFGHLDFVLNLAAPKLYDIIIDDMKSLLSV